MRALTASFFASLDGVVEYPQNWHFPSFSPDANAAVLADLEKAETIVLGRVTYQEWLPAWPPQGTSNPMAAKLNTTPKIIVSTTLDQLAWTGSILLRGDVVETLAAEKDQPGGEIAVIGSPTLVTALLQAGLVDELRLLVHPVVVGTGKRLFDGGPGPYHLTLTDSRTYAAGAVGLTYRPAGGEGSAGEYRR
jgi:dihydrofolate reductase